MKVFLFVIVLVVGLIGFAVLFTNPLLGIILLGVASVLIIACLRRKQKPDDGVSISAPDTSTASRPAAYKAKRNLHPVGNVDAVCPHCNQRLDKKPGRKKQCPHCGEFMFVRTRPSDEQQVLVTEAEAEEIESSEELPTVLRWLDK